MFNQLDEAKKSRIIQAAMSEFAEKGFDAASTNEIARNAGISKGSLFHYFGTKEKLYSWLIEYGISVVEEALYASDDLRQSDFIEVLVRSALIKLKVFQAHPALKDFFIRIYETDPGTKAPWADQLTKVLGRFQTVALDKVDPVKFRSDLELAQAFKLSYWIIDGMAKDFQQSGGPYDEATLWALTTDMMTMLKKLLYKEEYQ